MPRGTLKRRADGRFTCRKGNQFFYGATQAEAKRKREEYEKLIDAGLRADLTVLSFGDYAARWVHAYKTDCSQSTFNAYIHYIEDAGQYIGRKAMKDITATDMQIVYNAQAGKSDSHIKKYCATMKSIFETAVEDGAIQRNPCRKLKKPEGESGTHRALEQWEIDAVEGMVGKHDFDLAAMFMLYAGLRRGEVLALDIDRDVDLVAGVIHVRGAVSFDTGNQPTAKQTTKTDAGLRDVPLLDPLREALVGRHGLVATRESGAIMSKSAVARKWDSYTLGVEELVNGRVKRWYGRTKEDKALIAAGGELPPWTECTIRMHDFRHTFCTFCWEAGIDIKTVMEWMGHADEQMIVKIYAHLTEKKKREGALALGKVVTNRRGSQNGSQDGPDDPKIVMFPAWAIAADA